MMDYEKTLHLFFVELIAYLEHVKAQIRPDDIKRLSDVNYGLMVAGTVASNPQLYANYDVRARARLEQACLADAMASADGRDKTALAMYRRALMSMTYYFFGGNSFTRLMAKAKISDALSIIKSQEMSR